MLGVFAFLFAALAVAPMAIAVIDIAYFFFTGYALLVEWSGLHAMLATFWVAFWCGAMGLIFEVENV